MPLMRPQESATGQLLVGHVDVAAGTNLIENGDYELDIAGSRPILGPERLEHDSTVARHGGASLRVGVPNTDGTGVAWVTRAGPRIACRPGQSGVFSVDVYAPPAAAGKQVRVSLRWHAAAPGEAVLGTVEGPTHTLAEGWQPLSVQAGPAPRNTASITPVCACVTAQGRFDFYVDVAHLELGEGPILGPRIPTNHGPVSAPDRTGEVLRWDARLGQWQPGTVTPWFDVTWYGADPTGRADSTEAIRAAMTDAAGGGGAVVYIPAGEYLFTQIRMKSRVILCGQGHKTTLYQMAGTEGLDGIVCDAPATEKVVIRDLRLVGNRAHQPTANRGIYLSQPGMTFGDFDGGDSAPTLMNLWLVEWKGAAVATDHLVRDLCAIRVHVNRCDGPGFDLRCTDSSLVSCSAGGCAQGFNVRSYNTHYTTCKAFGSHGDSASPGDGFYISAAGAKLSACEAQDNWGRGFVLSNASNCVLTSVAADTNGVKLIGDNSVGIRIEGSRHCIVIGSAWNREGEPATQEYALEIADGAHDLVVMLTSREHGSGHIRGDTGESNWVVINGRPRLPMVATDRLPRAGAAVDGTILIEKGGRASRNLIYYTGGQRLRVAGTPF